MASKPNGSIKSPVRLDQVREDGPTWVIIVGGALLSTLSIKLYCKLKQVFKQKRHTRSRGQPRENGKSVTGGRHEPCKSHSNACCCALDVDGCCWCASGFKLSTADNEEFLWAAAAELPPKPFIRRNSSESLCVSESGSDIFIKRVVLKKLRLELRSRDDAIMEMQAQITDLQSSLAIQMAHAAHLQHQLRSSDEFLSESEKEIRQLQKSIADDRVGDDDGEEEGVRVEMLRKIERKEQNVE